MNHGIPCIKQVRRDCLSGIAVVLEALCSGLQFTVGGGIRKKAPSNFSIKIPRQSLCLVNIRLASNLPFGKEKKTMKLPQITVLLCVLIVCLTLLVIT